MFTISVALLNLSTISWNLLSLVSLSADLVSSTICWRCVVDSFIETWATLGIAPALGAGKPYSATNRQKVGLAGPAGSLGYNLYEIMLDTGSGNYDYTTARAKTMVHSKNFQI